MLKNYLTTNMLNGLFSRKTLRTVEQLQKICTAIFWGTTVENLYSHVIKFKNKLKL